MACLHETGGCTSTPWRHYCEAAEGAANEYFILAARMYFQFEAALKRHEESGEGKGEGMGDGGAHRDRGSSTSRKRVRVPWAVMRRVNWGQCRNLTPCTNRPLRTARPFCQPYDPTHALRTNRPALTVGLDDDLKAQAG